MTPRRRNFLILGGVGAVAAAAGGLLSAVALQSRSGVGGLLSSSFVDLAGEPRRLAQWQGRALVCNFWATWCAPCREEMPLFEAVHQQYAPKGVQLVGIAVDNAANVREFTNSVRVTYPILIGGVATIDLMRDLGNKSGALPFTVLLDARRRLVGHKLGAYARQELEAALAGLIQ